MVPSRVRGLFPKKWGEVFQEEWLGMGIQPVEMEYMDLYIRQTLMFPPRSTNTATQSGLLLKYPSCVVKAQCGLSLHIPMLRP
jgi:hypothetical protein